MSNDEKNPKPLETVGNLWSVLFCCRRYLLSQTEQQHVPFKGLYSGASLYLSSSTIGFCLASNTKYFLLYNHFNIYLPLALVETPYLNFIFNTSDCLFSAMRLGGLGQTPGAFSRTAVCAVRTFPVSWNTEDSSLNSLALGFPPACWISYQISQV